MKFLFDLFCTNQRLIILCNFLNPASILQHIDIYTRIFGTGTTDSERCYSVEHAIMDQWTSGVSGASISVLSFGADHLLVYLDPGAPIILLTLGSAHLAHNHAPQISLDILGVG